MYQAIAAQLVASQKCSQEYIPWEPSGLKITITQTENPAMAATARRDRTNGATAASGQE